MAQDRRPTFREENRIGSIYTQLLHDELTEYQRKRVMNEWTYWRFYLGDQWRTKRHQRPGSDNKATGENRNTLNYCKGIVDKGVAFLMGKGFHIDVPDNARQVTKPLLDEVWDDNDRELMGLDIAQSGGITGSAFIKIAVEQFDPDEDPEKAELYPEGRIRLILLPSYNVFPTYHAHDRDKMTKCVIMYPITLENERNDGTTEREQVIYREVITRDTIREFINGEEVESRENALNEIPVARIKNLPCAGGITGISDLQDIVPLQREFNYKSTDISDIINYHAEPITIVKGAKVNKLEKGSRKVWGGIPKDGDVYNLELQSDLRAALNYLELIKTAMFELSRMPEDAFGKEMNISNTSGVALHIKNQPLMELTRMKWKTYGAGIKKVNRLIIKYARLIEHPLFEQVREEFENLRAYEKYQSSVIFPDPLPKDELVQMQLITQKVKDMLMSRKDALVELGVKNPEEKLREIFAENKIVENLIYDGDYQQLQELEEALELNIGGILRKDEKVEPINEG